MSWTLVSYLYDGTYAGFLTCVFDSFRHREEPADFTPFSEAAASFYPQRAVETHQEKARRVYRSLDQFGREGKRWAVRGFLTCLEERELWLWRFYQLGFEEKGAVSRDLTHPVVDTVRKAVRHLEEEAHLLTGFVRFSELDGVLAGEISPKNRVLPLLRALPPGAVSALRQDPPGGPHSRAGPVVHPPHGGVSDGPGRGGGAPVPAHVAEILRHHRHPGAGEPPVPHDPHAQAVLGQHDGVSAGGAGDRSQSGPRPLSPSVSRSFYSTHTKFYPRCHNSGGKIVS